jgi:hypothetical protein
MACSSFLMYASLSEDEEEDEREEEREERDGAGVGVRMSLSSSAGERVREDVSRYSCMAGERGEWLSREL